MARELKFDYIVKDDDRLQHVHVTLDEIENGMDEDADVVARRQYTCLHDMNGVEIYEGDILETYIPHGTRDIGAVDYQGSGFWRSHKPTNQHDLPYQYINPLQCHVIGNIYENAGLLEKAS